LDNLTPENIVNYTTSNISLVKEQIKNKFNKYFQGSQRQMLAGFIMIIKLM